MEEEAESSGGEQEPGDLHEWGAVEEEAGFPDFPVWWEVVGEGQKQGPGMEAEEGGLRGSLWMEEVGAELSCVGEEEVGEEEELHHGTGVEGVLGAETNQSGIMWPRPQHLTPPSHSRRELAQGLQGAAAGPGAQLSRYAGSHLASSARSSPPPPLPSSR